MSVSGLSPGGGGGTHVEVGVRGLVVDAVALPALAESDTVTAGEGVELAVVDGSDTLDEGEGGSADESEGGGELHVEREEREGREGREGRNYKVGCRREERREKRGKEGRMLDEEMGIGG